MHCMACLWRRCVHVVPGPCRGHDFDASDCRHSPYKYVLNVLSGCRVIVAHSRPSGYVRMPRAFSREGLIIITIVELVLHYLSLVAIL